MYLRVLQALIGMGQKRVTTTVRMSLYVVVVLLVSTQLLAEVGANGWLSEVLQTQVGLPNPWWVPLLG